MKKTIYFDFDGTLHDTLFVYRNAVQAAYDELRLKIDLPKRAVMKEEAMHWLGLSPMEMWQSFMPDLDSEIRDHASKRVGEFMKTQLERGEGKLYDGVLETLKELTDRGYILKILSNCREGYRDIAMKVFGIEKYITEFIAAETYDFEPKYEIISHIKGDEQIVAFVGDRKSDIDAGKYNQIQTIACGYGYGSEEELMDADVVIYDIRDLLKIFA